MNMLDVMTIPAAILHRWYYALHASPRSCLLHGSGCKGQYESSHEYDPYRRLAAAHVNTLGHWQSISRYAYRETGAGRRAGADVHVL